MNHLIRFSVLFVFHILFKQGDVTFSGAFEPSLRSLSFSLYFLAYWMIIWEICNRVFIKLMKGKTEGRLYTSRLLFTSLILMILMIPFTVVFNQGYYFFDQHLFRTESDIDVPFLNPEIFHTAPVFRIIHLNPEMFYGFILLFFLVYGTHIFILSIRNARDMEIKAERQKKENILAQYMVLRNQIDPHFFFNSLSVLSSLIHESTELSDSYITHLSKHYRYILENPADHLVTIQNEINFLESYIFLITMRYPDQIEISVNLSPELKSKGKLIPHVLQMLVENAIKHNRFTRDNPLSIVIDDNNGFVNVTNNINKRKMLNQSAGIGLQNIKQRYTLETSRQVIVEEDEHRFSVKLPLL